MRAEILMQIDHHRREYLILFPIIGTILTLAITSEQPWFCLLAFFLNLYSWRHYRAIAFTVMKLGAYISIFIEPETKGLRYESIISKVDAIAARKSSLLHGNNLFNIIITPHAVISLASILLGLYLICKLNFIRGYFPHLLILATIISIIHSAVIYKIFKNGTIEERQYWQRLFRLVKEETS